MYLIGHANDKILRIRARLALPNIPVNEMTSILMPFQLFVFLARKTTMSTFYFYFILSHIFVVLRLSGFKPRDLSLWPGVLPTF